MRSPKEILSKFIPASIIPLIEDWAIIAVWAVFIGRKFLNMAENAYPYGEEFLMTAQNNYVWTLLDRCGACFFWNGFSNGGAPSFIDLHSGWLHPVVAIGTLLLGVVNGSKIAILFSLFIAGISQWWIARTLGMNRITGLWGALLVVAGGHLAGRMETGNVPLLLSVASTSLALAGLLQFLLKGGVRNAALFGLTFGLAILSGQGYLQIGFVLGILPVVLYLAFKPAENQPPANWRHWLLAAGIALLVAAVLLVPLAHFWPNYGKDIDPNFSSAQPIKFSLLNLVIDNSAFYETNLLEKQPYGYLYANFIGWIPVGLAVIAITRLFEKQKRLTIALLVMIAATYLISSAAIFKFLYGLNPNPLLAFVRNPPVIQSLVVPLLVIFAAWTFEAMYTSQWWQDMQLSLTNAGGKSFPLYKIPLERILALTLALLALYPAYKFSQTWYFTVTQAPLNQEVYKTLYTPDAQWIQLPAGEFYWMPQLRAGDYKVGYQPRPWRWAGHEMPAGYIDVVRDSAFSAYPGYMTTIDGLYFVKHPENLYAFIKAGEALLPCRAKAAGGDITVTCESNEQGLLVVRENAWTGWSVQMDGKPAELIPDKVLATVFPGGKHTFTFRYRPWDAPLGALLSVAGILLAIYLAVKPPKEQTAE